MPTSIAWTCLNTGASLPRSSPRTAGMRSRFHVPFHRHGGENWGIYFVGDPFLGAVDAVQSVMSSAGAAKSQAWVAWALIKAVHVHELTHFAVELAAAHAEAITGSASLYQAYVDVGRANGLREPALTEEAIATVREIRRAKRIDRSFASALGELSEGLPGYGDFARHLRQDDAGRRVLLSHLVGPVSTSELLGDHVARPYYRSVPVHWLPPRLVPAGLDDLLPRIIALPLRRVRTDARRRPGVIVNEHAGGDHPTKIEKGKQFVPVSLNWDRVPHDVVKQIATLFGLTPGEYCAQVLNKRLRPRRA